MNPREAANLDLFQTFLKQKHHASRCTVLYSIGNNHVDYDNMNLTLKFHRLVLPPNHRYLLIDYSVLEPEMSDRIIELTMDRYVILYIKRKIKYFNLNNINGYIFNCVKDDG